MAERYIAANLGGLFSGSVAASTSFRGGRVAAEHIMSQVDLTGYEQKRHTAFPAAERGTTRLAPYLSSGLVSLAEAWGLANSTNEADNDAFRNELLWTEYARHWFGALGDQAKYGLDREIIPLTKDVVLPDPQMGCMELTASELSDDGWIVNEQRLWFISWWVSAGNSWQSGAEFFERHLLDNDEATNLLRWQTTAGLLGEDRYEFTRWAVEHRAKGLCASCDLAAACPVEEAMPEPAFESKSRDGLTNYAVDLSAKAIDTADAVLITEEHLGDSAALQANPGLPVVFVFDEPRLHSYKYSSRRAIFTIESLAALTADRSVEVYLGDPQEFLDQSLVGGRKLAANRQLDNKGITNSGHDALVELHPWNWLVEPSHNDVSSFEVWMSRSGVSAKSSLDATNGKLFTGELQS